MIFDKERLCLFFSSLNFQEAAIKIKQEEERLQQQLLKEHAELTAVRKTVLQFQCRQVGNSQFRAFTEDHQ